MRHLLLAALALAIATSATAPNASAQTAPKQEFRGAWIATVLGLDWPSCRTCTPAQQQAELRTILDRLKAAGINAALFQVRVESDAMYRSAIEPSSYWITGEQGKALAYDPLEFAVAEAHARGMELHAWFNPYRVERAVGNYVTAPNHVTKAHPEWILNFGTIKILDPGLPEVRNYITSVVMDVARRYDIDGVHFDDYFYPYEGIGNQDDASFAAYGAGFTRANWRRFNVFRFVRQVGDSLRAVRPDVSYGISPFGITSGDGVPIPAGITGLDGYSALYADALGWLNNRLLDYITPQLYWAFGGSQDYGILAPWWEARRNGRHLYPGHGLYRADANTFSNTLYSQNEVPRQVRFNRRTPGIQGSVFFRALNITQYSSKGFADSLRTTLYRTPALTPTMEWKSLAAPGQPLALSVANAPGGGLALAWSAPAAGDARARFYAVYRLTPAEASNLPAALADPSNLAAVTGQTTYMDRGVANGEEVVYAVTAVSPNSVESAPSTTLRVTDGEAAPTAEARLALSAPYPNPTTATTRLDLTLGAPATVSARVVDALGREIAVLMDAEALAAGPHALTWDPRRAGPGTYFVVVAGDGVRAVRPVNVVR